MSVAPERIPCVFELNKDFDDKIIGCTKGEDCPYSHSTCVPWLEGRCEDGKACDLEHYRICAFNALGKCNPTKVCIFFQQDKCKKGDRCKFLHSKSPTAGRCPRAHVVICPDHLKNACPFRTGSEEDQCNKGLHPKSEIMKEIREVYARSQAKK